MRLTDRLKLVTSHKLCRHCLGFHALAKCKSKSNCFVCHKSNHHTHLHRYFSESQYRKGNGSAPAFVYASDHEKKQNPSSIFSDSDTQQIFVSVLRRQELQCMKKKIAN